MRIDEAAEILRAVLDTMENLGSGKNRPNPIREAIDTLMPIDPERLTLMGRVPASIGIVITWPGGDTMTATAVFTRPDSRATLDLVNHMTEDDDDIRPYRALNPDGLHNLTLELENVRFVE
ncbi:MAG: hypothetical protein MUF33_02125 [Candidatus Nanopelagicales bacterium]|nr:hypothetical protein [Candidatus Nanopelagicales bacterium]